MTTNGQVLDVWGRWMTAALQGTSSMDMWSGWWQNGIRSMAIFGRPWALPWLQPINAFRTADMLNGVQQVWEPFFNLQKLSLQFMGMVPQEKYQALAERAEVLEKKVQEQAHTIERLQALLNRSSGENNVVVTQLQDLIGEQSKQFKQLSKSVGEYIKSSAKEISAKK